MFNIGSGELALIAIVALLILGPKRLPELARGIGKFVREFRKQTDEVRGVVEREFYRMDSDIQSEGPPKVTPAKHLAGDDERPMFGPPTKAPVPPAGDGTAADGTAAGATEAGGTDAGGAGAAGAGPGAASGTAAGGSGAAAWEQAYGSGTEPHDELGRPLAVPTGPPAGPAAGAATAVGELPDAPLPAPEPVKSQVTAGMPADEETR